MNPATSSGQVEVRLNQMPLAIESPPVLMQIWPVDCVNLRKTRDLFVSTLSPGSDGSSRGDHAELLDKSLALLQAKIQKKKRDIPHDASFDPGKRVQIHRDLQEAKLYLESLRLSMGMNSAPNPNPIMATLTGLLPIMKSSAKRPMSKACPIDLNKMTKRVAVCNPKPATLPTTNHCPRIKPG